MQIVEAHRNLFNSLNILRSAISLLQNPGGTDSVYKLEESLINNLPTQVSFEFIKSQAGIESLISERYLAPVPDLQQFLQYPENSLGHRYAKYIQSFGFDPLFYRNLQVKDDLTYILMRRRQTHDIWHVITGFGVDVASELGLKAFELAQTRSPMSALLVAGGLVRTLFESPEDLGYLLDRIAVGYRMGAKAKPLLAQKWEENWEKPIEQWREELNVEVSPSYIP
ncbi:MAG: Coq4 family protein [Microcoleaceae cyanobacterium]